MSASTLRLILAGVLFVHGIGHFLGIMAALQLGTANVEGWTSDLSLLTGIVNNKISRALCFVLFFAALLLSVSAGMALMGWLIPHEWWRLLAIVSAAISSLTLILFWNAFPSLIPNKLGALIVDIAIFVLLIWQRWPTETAIGY